jgi:hypothetical protein
MFYLIIIISRLVNTTKIFAIGVFEFPQEMKGWVFEIWVTPVNYKGRIS